MGLSGEGIIIGAFQFLFQSTKSCVEIKKLASIDDFYTEHIGSELHKQCHIRRRKEGSMGVPDGIGEALHEGELGLHPQRRRKEWIVQLLKPGQEATRSHQDYYSHRACRGACRTRETGGESCGSGIPAEKDKDRSEDQFEVIQEAPVLLVTEIKLDHIFEISNRGTSGDLPFATEPRTYIKPLPSGDGIALHFIGSGWPGSNQTHVANEHIPELG